MDFSLSSLAAGFVFGVLGVYLIRRAKREANAWDLAIGVVLLAYPYFVSNPFLMWGLGGGLLVLAHFMR